MEKFDLNKPFEDEAYFYDDESEYFILHNSILDEEGTSSIFKITLT